MVSKMNMWLSYGLINYVLFCFLCSCALIPTQTKKWKYDGVEVARIGVTSEMRDGNQVITKIDKSRPLNFPKFG
jgi:hypothetical protein